MATIMCIRLIAMSFLCQTFRLHGLKIEEKKAWPYWKTMEAMGPAKLWPFMHASSINNSTYTAPWMRGTCQIADKASPDDLKASISTNGLVKAVTAMNGEMNAEGFFPSSYNEGFVISAGPPPNVKDGKPDNQYQYNNMIRWANEMKEFAGANTKLLAALNAYKADGKISKFMPVNGVYEGSSEGSYVCETSSANKAQYGEELRGRFYQDSYLLFDGVKEGTDHSCQADLNNNVKPAWYRSFSLGFGPTGPRGIPLGDLCEYAAPTNLADLPKACSVNGQKMWTDNPTPYSVQKLN